MVTSTRSRLTAVADSERNRRRDLPRRSAADDASATAPVVFAIDDDSSIRDSLRRLLMSVGFNVEAFPLSATSRARRTRRFALMPVALAAPPRHR